MNESRYERVLTEVMALAEEAEIRGNELDRDFVLWQVLAHNLKVAVGDATDGVLNDEKIGALQKDAGFIAVGRVGNFRS